MAMKFSINNDFSFNAKTYVPKQYDSKDIYSNMSYDDIEDIDYSKGIDDSEDLSELEEVEKSLNLYNCVQQLTNDEIKKMEGLEYSFVQKTDLIYKYEGLVLDSNSGLLCTPEGYSSFLASNPDYRGISLDEYTLLYNMEFSKYMELNYGEALDYKTFKDKLKCLYDDYQSLGEVLYSLRQQQKALDFNEKYPLSDEDSYLSNGKIEVKLAQRPGSVRETDVILVFTLNGKQLTDQELTKLNPMEVLETLKNSPHSKYFSADNDMLKKYDFFEHLTDDQKNLYNRYYTKYGRGVADDYLESIKDTINAQVGYNEAMSAIDDALKKNGNISNSEMIVTAFGDGVSFFLEGVENLGDADGIKTSTQYKQLYIMQYLAENEPDKFTQMCYEFGFTVGNMAPSMAVSIALGPAGSTVASLGGQMAMGMSVLGNSRNEALISGSTEFKAWSYGVLSSMSEVTLGLMLGNIPFLNADASLSITGILEEGFEELLQEYVGAGLQASILGTPIDISQLEGDALKSFLFGCLLSMGSNTAVGTVNIVGNVLNINGKTVDLSNPNSIVEAIKEIDSNSSLNKNDSVDTTGGYELKEGESLSGKVGIQFFGGKTKNNSSNYFYDNIAHVNQMAQHGQFYAFDVQNFADIPSDFWSKINDPSLLFFRKDGKTYSFDDAKRLSESLNDVSKISVQNQTVVNNNTASPRRGFKLLNSVVAGAASDPNNVIPGVVKNQSTNINNVNSNAVFDNMVSKLGDNGARKALWFYVNNGDTKYIPVELLSQVQGISTDTINKFLDSKIKNKNLDNTNGYELKEGESLSGKVGIQFFGDKTSNVTSGVETNAGNGMVSSNVDTLNYGKVNTPKYILDYLASNIRKYAYRNTNSFTGLNDSIMKNGLYHFTGAADAIMSSGYIKASSFNKSYGNKKSFFFNGVPDVGAFAMNLDAVPVKTVAVKVVPNAELVNSSKLKLRYVDDMAITYDGNLDLKGLNVEKCFFGLEVEDGKLVYKQISESEYNSYENTDIAKNLMPYISNKSNIKNIKASFLNDISIRNRSNNNTDMSSVINSKAHDVNFDHGMQLDRRDFGGFYKTKIETGFFTEQQVANMLNRVNAFGYISSEAGEHYSSLFNEDYDIYVKTIHSSDLASIMSEGVRCLGTSTSGYGVAPTDINDINLDNTISGVDGTYDLINTLKSANGISQGGNPIDGTLVLKIPKGTNKNNILYFNQTSGTYCIKPEFIDSFSAVDANGVVAEPTFNNINDETLNLEKKIETKQQEYSVFKLQEINDDVSNYQEICDLFLSLTNDIETKNKLEEILYYGGYNGYGLDSNLSNKNNPYFEAQRRISMANLLITNPFTFDAVVKNNINLFHGTNSNALASILKYGLDNFDNLKSKEIQVSTGERWSRSSGRNFTSLTDVLNIAEGYSTINLDQFSFEVIIGTTVDEAKKSRIIPVGSDTPEVGIRNCLPVESIKTLLVPSDKVEFVKSIISNNEIEVLPYDIDKNNFYWFDYDSGMIVIDNDKVNEISASLKKDFIDYELKENESLAGVIGTQFFADTVSKNLSTVDLQQLREKFNDIVRKNNYSNIANDLSFVERISLMLDYFKEDDFISFDMPVSPKIISWSIFSNPEFRQNIFSDSEIEYMLANSDKYGKIIELMQLDFLEKIMCFSDDKKNQMIDVILHLENEIISDNNKAKFILGLNTDGKVKAMQIIKRKGILLDTYYEDILYYLDGDSVIKILTLDNVLSINSSIFYNIILKLTEENRMYLYNCIDNVDYREKLFESLSEENQFKIFQNSDLTLENNSFLHYYRDYFTRKILMETMLKSSEQNKINLKQGVLDIVDELKQKGVTSDLEIARAVYLYLGKEVSYTHEYTDITNPLFASKINQEYLENVSRNVICYTWAALYKEALITAGINPEHIKILNYNNNNHHYVCLKLNDLYYIADATYGYSNYGEIDLVGIKIGRNTTGFFESSYAEEIFNGLDGTLIGGAAPSKVAYWNRYTDFDSKITTIDEKIGFIREDRFYEKVEILRDLLKSTEEVDLSVDEISDMLIRVLNIPNMNANDTYALYSLINGNKSSVKFATYGVDISEVNTNYVLLSVLRDDGSIKYYMKEDFGQFKEIQNVDETIENMLLYLKRGDRY